MAKRTRKTWTYLEDDLMRKLYSDTKTEVLATKLNRTVCSLYGRADYLGLKKSKDFLASPDSGRIIKGSETGAQYRFTKGNIPVNKGVKMTDEQYEKCKTTFFKKGNKPFNIKYDGAISTRRDKRTGIAYKYIRISERNWELLHRYNYKKKYGNIPTNIFLRCIDGDQLNCDPNNWEPINMSKNMKLNLIHQYPPELQELIKLNNKLKKQIDGRH